MEKYGFSFTNNMGELVCNAVYQLKNQSIIELTICGVEQEDGTFIDEVDEMETDWTSFEELEMYFDRKTQAVLKFGEFKTINEALKIIGTKIRF